MRRRPRDGVRGTAGRVGRVALVASSFAPRVGGVEEHVRRVASGLRARGHDVVVWTVDQGDEPVHEVDGVRVRYLPTPLPNRSLGGMLRFAPRALRAAVCWLRAMAADRPTVLHVQCFGPNGPWASAVARLTRRRLVVTSHGETFMDADDAFDRSIVLRRSLAAALRRADAVTACSDFTARDLERRFGLAHGRATVVANGVDLDEASGPAPPGLPERYVLAVGRAVRTKGFDLLIDAFAAAAVPGVSLVIGGDGPGLDLLRWQVAEFGIGDRVSFAGRLGRGEVVAAMAGAVALVVPSRIEAFGIVVLEGWRAGVPVIATSHGGPADLVTDGVDGVLVDPQDTAAFAAALRRVTGDPALAHRLGAAGAEAVVPFTWASVVAGYEAVYDGLARRGPHA